MAKIGSTATAKVIQLLSSIDSAAGMLADSNDEVDGESRRARHLNAAADLVEKSEVVRYPAIQVYSEKLVNSLTEKFRRFSGSVEMAIEIRQSQDQLQGLQRVLEEYVDTVTQVLDSNRGDWGSGMFYGGVYQVTFGAAKRGGRNYIQTAKISFEIGVSIS